MRIFISWSGERSRAVALGLREWLPLVLHYAEPWMSDVDIPAGQRWSAQIAECINTSEFAIICCTENNLAAPWLLFEAGALANALAEDSVCPLLLDVSFSEISGPLAQFQAKKSDFHGVLDLVSAINLKAESPIQEDRLRELFRALWPMLHAQLNAISASIDQHSQTRSTADVLEELVTSVRNLERRVEEIAIEHAVPGITYDSRAYGAPAPMARLPLEPIREFARAQVARTSLRKVAMRAGVKVGATKKFIDGGTPYERNLRLWQLWYIREIAGMVNPPPGWGAWYPMRNPATDPAEEATTDESGEDPEFPDGMEEAV